MTTPVRVCFNQFHSHRMVSAWPWDAAPEMCVREVKSETSH